MTKRTLILLSFLILAIASRFLILAGPAWANFSPMGSMALFGGYYIKDKKIAVLFSLLALWVSNMLLNNLLYEAYFKRFSWGFSWSQFTLFAAITLIGAWFSTKKARALNVLLVNAFTSLGFFIASNFLVWAFSSEVIYTKNIAGLSACYINAIPFYPNSLYSHLLFGILFFGGFEFLKSKDKALA